MFMCKRTGKSQLYIPPMALPNSLAIRVSVGSRICSLALLRRAQFHFAAALALRHQPTWAKLTHTHKHTHRGGDGSDRRHTQTHRLRVCDFCRLSALCVLRGATTHRTAPHCTAHRLSCLGFGIRGASKLCVCVYLQGELLLCADHKNRAIGIKAKFTCCCCWLNFLI